MWCMWLSDSGSGFGKIVKRQTDLQKKCQKGLHNDKIGTFRDWKALKTGHFRSLCFCSGSILVLLSEGIMWFCVFLMWKLTI